MTAGRRPRSTTVDVAAGHRAAVGAGSGSGLPEMPEPGAAGASTVWPGPPVGHHGEPGQAQQERCRDHGELEQSAAQQPGLVKGSGCCYRVGTAAGAGSVWLASWEVRDRRRPPVKVSTTVKTRAIYALAFGLAFAGVFYGPAYQSLLPTVVPAHVLGRANALSWSTVQSSHVLGAATAPARLLLERGRSVEDAFGRERGQR